MCLDDTRVLGREIRITPSSPLVLTGVGVCEACHMVGFKLWVPFARQTCKEMTLTSGEPTCTQPEGVVFILALLILVGRSASH